MPDEDTTIRIKLDTWSRLNDRKDRPNKSFDDVINELLDIAEDVEGADEGNRRAVAMTAD